MAQGYGRGSAMAALAVVAAFGVTACDRGGNGGSTTTVIQTAAPSAASTSTTPSVSPINDRTKLCSRALGRARDVTSASEAYWKLVHESGFGDQEVNEAGDKFRQAAVKTLPLLKGLVGPGAPQDVADAVEQYTEAADKFSEAAGAHSLAEEINPLASKFADAIDALDKACPK